MKGTAAASTAGVSSFRLVGFRGEGLKRVHKAIHTQLLPSPEKTARAGRVVGENLYRVTSRVAWPGCKAALLKVHHARGVLEKLMSRVRRGRARAEWDVARHMYAVGLPVPEPWAYGEERKGLGLSRSFFVGAFLDGVRELNDALTEDQPRAKRAALLERSARLIRAMHDRGCDHRDLHAGNILVGPGPGDRCALYIIDLHRAATGRPMSTRRRIRALGPWLYSLTTDDGDAGWEAVLRAYGGGDTPLARALLARAPVAARAARSAHIRSRSKRCVRQSSDFTNEVGEGRGFRRRSLSTERLARALMEHDDAMTRNDHRVAKRGRKSAVTCHGDVVVKETIPAGWSGRVKNLVAPDRHRQGYENAHRLGMRQIFSPWPLAYVREAGRVYTLYQDVSPFPRLDTLARETFRDGRPAARRSLLAQSADWVRDLHERGIYHGDLKGVNVRVDTANPAKRVFYLIDTDRCRFFDDPVDERRRVKNLAQLAASIPLVVTRTDRLRWFRRYAKNPVVARREKEIARRVAEQLAQKRIVVDEPIE